MSFEKRVRADERHDIRMYVSGVKKFTSRKNIATFTDKNLLKIETGLLESCTISTLTYGAQTQATSEIKTETALSLLLLPHH